MSRLAGKVALISGAARGMGAAEARLFAREGARVVLADVLTGEGKAVEDDITAKGGQAVFAPLDVTREADWTRVVALAESRFGALHILVNNAGIGAPSSRVEATTLEAWQRVMDVNATGVFLGTKAAIPALRRAGGGSIINISSQLGLVGTEDSTPQYTASKGAVRLLTKTTALQYATEGIRANSVHPGGIMTTMTATAFESFADITDGEGFMRSLPISRFAKSSEVSPLVIYLASDESSYCTGSEFVVDGGMLSGPGY